MKIYRAMMVVVIVTTSLLFPRWSVGQQDVPTEQLPDLVGQAPPAIPKFVKHGLEWLIAAQHANGGWGAGSHAHQQEHDPHHVQVDPATTSFVGLTLLRAGHTPSQGAYRENVCKALEYLIGVVETSDSDGPRITHLEGTQPQQKLGPYVDTALTAQYLARILPTVPSNDPLYKRIHCALEKCLTKLTRSQQQDGSWGRQGGWAPVLQSSLSCTALEFAATNGMPVDKDALARAREYQQSNVDGKSGRATVDASAGVELYAFAAGGRGNAAEARAAEEAVAQAVDRGILPHASAVDSIQNLKQAGMSAERAEQLASAYAKNQVQLGRLNDETLLAGFGNNGGEEFLSYVLTSETLVISGGDQFHQWDKKMRRRLKRIQNDDGSWSGHHCITSPVFCTAAVIQCLSAERDADFLVSIATKQGN